MARVRQLIKRKKVGMSFPPDTTTPAPKVEEKPAKPISPFVKKILAGAWDNYGDQIKTLAMSSIDTLQARLPELWDQLEKKLTEDDEFKAKTINQINEVLDQYAPQVVDAVMKQIDKTLTAK